MRSFHLSWLSPDRNCLQRKRGSDRHTHTAMYKIGNQKGLTVWHREVYSVLCGDQTGKEIQKREDTYIHMADSLCCTAETDTAM